LEVKVKRLSDEVNLPKYQTAGSVGFDLEARENVTILAGKTALVSTGLFFELPDGFEIQVRPRSGLALKHSITVLNSPGTVDSDYRGELKVILINHGEQPFEIKIGERIAQAVINKVEIASFTEVAELSKTERASKGFGSTGK
jgi:dUTP pyrophosphatase